MNDDASADALIRMFEQAMKTVFALPVGQRQAMLDRLAAVRDMCGDFGYGASDMIWDLWGECVVDMDCGSSPQ